MAEIGRFTYRGVEYAVRTRRRKGRTIKAFSPADGAAFPQTTNVTGVIAAYKRWLRKYEAA